MGSIMWLEWSPGKAREDRSGGGAGSMVKEERLSLNVWVDHAKKRVVLAEASNDFVDVLFSFLTLPLGTIVRLLSKNSDMGSIDNLYDSIEKLGDQYWRTEACRNMLLSPRNAAGKHCEELKLNVDGDNNSREFCYCKMESFISRSKCYFSSVRDRRCHCCGEVMDEAELLEKVETIENDGVFVKKNSVKYIITDDFHVKPYSVSYYYDMLKDSVVEDMYLMEERTLEFGREEITLFLNRTNNNVVCAELEEELANQLFSFLTFPLGSVLGLIGYSNFLGCMTNLYNSI
ncbi:hypothetical protein IEQ34_022799 [Dendrobium chrysotoxum]|uniref:DUF674 family protein n=1 Tax=Dendrobium chrysotoxum TaxID=161865 RepID=A0AAV7G006_DENCH|nr:hypothetical protein IEQ34_022799 [Dendrobium chrysotoxum]